MNGRYMGIGLKKAISVDLNSHELQNVKTFFIWRKGHSKVSKLLCPNFWQIKTFGGVLAPPAPTPLGLPFIHIHICFSSWEGHEDSNPRRTWKYPPQSLIIMLAPHQDEIKQGRWFYHPISSLSHCPVGVASGTCLADISWTRDWTIIAKNCIRRSGSTFSALRIS